MRIRSLLFRIVACCLLSLCVFAQTQTEPASLQSLPVSTSSATVDSLLKRDATAWSQIAPKRVALNRTPPLYDTDEPAALEIPIVDVRCIRAQEKLIVHLVWHDPTQDAVALPEVPKTAPETRFDKVQTEASDRFFDAAAVMFPTNARAGDLSPSLQMGDPDHPVQIYYWNATRGAMLMEAHGRSTTHRTGQSFLANAVYQNGQWNVTLVLPNLAAGTPVAFAVWNGSQKDRDGRKYFSVWQFLE
ncbi:MAG TPA: ethylbenzene dehydrogenase-related protein [Terriglobales bacterium]|nr:ethylbenzene dehydrogenase-related protein [Terriglobales bacterium]